MGRIGELGANSENSNLKVEGTINERNEGRVGVQRSVPRVRMRRESNQRQACVRYVNEQFFEAGLEKKLESNFMLLYSGQAKNQHYITPPS